MAQVPGVNSTVIQEIVRQCDINLRDYNYSFYRATVAACSAVVGNNDAKTLLVGFAGATFWICGELLLQLVSRFNSWKTLYPWTILVSTIGTIIIVVAHMLVHFTDMTKLALGLEAWGWIWMVTGFALVLFSRLHIVATSRRVLRICLILIVLSGLVCYVPIITASVYTGVHKPKLLRIGFCLEVLFFLCDNGLAALYIYYFIKFVGNWRQDTKAKVVLRNLILAELVVFAMDLVPLTLLYAEVYIPREAINPFTFAFKLKVEFWILNQLVRFSTAQQRGLRQEIVSIDIPHGSIVDEGSREGKSAGLVLNVGYSVSLLDSTDPDTEKNFEGDFDCYIQDNARYVGENPMDWIFCDCHNPTSIATTSVEADDMAVSLSVALEK